MYLIYVMNCEGVIVDFGCRVFVLYDHVRVGDRGIDDA